MLTSLRDKVLPLDDDVLVLPGHGGATTVGRERAVNPYLGALLDPNRPGARLSAPTRGL
jgi:glyoxylase-like metal-dependent hydrolase (beta-lactamase superfamily II)